MLNRGQSDVSAAESRGFGLPNHCHVGLLLSHCPLTLAILMHFISIALYVSTASEFIVSTCRCIRRHALVKHLWRYARLSNQNDLIITQISIISTISVSLLLWREYPSWVYLLQWTRSYVCTL